MSTLETRLDEWKTLAVRLATLVEVNMPHCEKLYHSVGQYHGRREACQIEEEMESALEEFERLKGIKP